MTPANGMGCLSPGPLSPWHGQDSNTAQFPSPSRSGFSKHRGPLWGLNRGMRHWQPGEFQLNDPQQVLPGEA